MLFTEKVIHKTFEHACKTRIKHSSNDSIWELKRRWGAERWRLTHKKQTGVYLFDSVKQIKTGEGILEILDAEDAV